LGATLRVDKTDVAVVVRPVLSEGTQLPTRLKVDVTDWIHISGPVDAVLHFASPASPADYLQLPIQTLKVGTLGTHNVLGLARAKVKIGMANLAYNFTRLDWMTRRTMTA